MTFKSIIEKIKTEKREPMEIIENWRQLAKKVLEMSSSDNFSAYVVTIPEWLGVDQSSWKK